MEIKVVAFDLGREKRCFIIVHQKVLKPGIFCGRKRLLQQSFWKDDVGGILRSKGTRTAAPNPVKSVCRRHYPGIGNGPFKFLTEVLEDGRVLWRNCGENIKSLVHSRGQACCCHVMAENAAIDYPGVER